MPSSRDDEHHPYQPFRAKGPAYSLQSSLPYLRTDGGWRRAEQRSNEATKQQKNEKDDDVNETKKEILKQI